MCFVTLTKKKLRYYFFICDSIYDFAGSRKGRPGHSRHEGQSWTGKLCQCRKVKQPRSRGSVCHLLDEGSVRSPQSSVEMHVNWIYKNNKLTWITSKSRWPSSAVHIKQISSKRFKHKKKIFEIGGLGLRYAWYCSEFWSYSWVYFIQTRLINIQLKFSYNAGISFYLK